MKRVVVKNTGDRPYARDKFVFHPGEESDPVALTERDIFGMSTVDFLEVKYLKKMGFGFSSQSQVEVELEILSEIDRLEELYMHELRHRATSQGIKYPNNIKKVDLVEKIRAEEAGD